MARVRNPKPSPRPMYPTSGRIHMILYERCATRLACLKVSYEKLIKGVNRTRISPNFWMPRISLHRPAENWPHQEDSQNCRFATTLYELKTDIGSNKTAASQNHLCD